MRKIRRRRRKCRRRREMMMIIDEENNEEKEEMQEKRRGSCDSSARADGYQDGDPRFQSQSVPSQFSIAPLCPPSTKWVARSLTIWRK
ncbi:hypothetical protein PoB_004645600 [Plakobranchus ocellatus]|uniref:Uncharacterized protein n=1 Tax=Plakobranchus ocellatus TaxID=259542 RepID=A0AAV4BLS0_9GAST|nr:hypothetical protein PoB_004645600 [Plakobranchus ocellatus]